MAKTVKIIVVEDNVGKGSRSVYKYKGMLEIAMHPITAAAVAINKAPLAM